jgi:hypothetical protein
MGVLAGSTFYGGVVNGYNNNIAGSGVAAPNLNAYVGATVATPVVGLRCGAAWDLLNVNTSVGGVKAESDMWSLALYASYQATEKLSLHARAEYISGDVDQPGGYTAATSVASPIPLGTLAGDVFNNGIYAVTATVQYDLWKNVLSRLEFRWDHAEHGNSFGSIQLPTGTASAENAFMLAANVIYKF